MSEGGGAEAGEDVERAGERGGAGGGGRKRTTVKKERRDSDREGSLYLLSLSPSLPLAAPPRRGNLNF